MTRRIPPMDGGTPPFIEDISDALPDATLEECELQGEWAYSLGVNANPYPLNSPEYDAWSSGWHDGLENDEG